MNCIHWEPSDFRELPMPLFTNALNGQAINDSWLERGLMMKLTTPQQHFGIHGADLWWRRLNFVFLQLGSSNLVKTYFQVQIYSRGVRKHSSFGLPDQRLEFCEKFLIMKVLLKSLKISRKLLLILGLNMCKDLSKNQCHFSQISHTLVKYWGTYPPSPRIYATLGKHATYMLLCERKFIRGSATLKRN